MTKEFSIDEINAIIEDTYIDDRRIRYETTGVKISEARTGRVVHTPEARAKLSAALKGYPISQERRDKIAAANKGNPLSEDRRSKISKAMSKYRFITPKGNFDTMMEVMAEFSADGYTRQQIRGWCDRGTNGFSKIQK
jgi:hypothetical protein